MHRRGLVAAAVVAGTIACGIWVAAAGAEAPPERPVIGWRVDTLSWAAAEVEEGGRDLHVAFWDAGGCGASRGPYFRVEEGRGWVALTVTVGDAIYAPTGHEACLQPLVTQASYQWLRLHRPLDGREVRGQTLKAPCLLAPGVSRCGGERVGRPIAVPNVVGFSFADAVRALAFDGLGASTRGRPAARQRVVAQSPATEELRPVKTGRKRFEVTERVEVRPGTAVRLRVAPLGRRASLLDDARTGEITKTPTGHYGCRIEDLAASTTV